MLHIFTASITKFGTLAVTQSSPLQAVARNVPHPIQIPNLDCGGRCCPAAGLKSVQFAVSEPQESLRSPPQYQLGAPSKTCRTHENSPNWANMKLSRSAFRLCMCCVVSGASER